MRITLLGKRWNLSFRSLARHRDPEGKRILGLCDHPETPNKTILIDNGLENQELLEILLHEMMHAVDWGLSEESISTQAHDIARVLWKLGYRRAADAQH